MEWADFERSLGAQRLLLAVEAAPESTTVISAAAKLAIRLQAEVVVLSVRERGWARGVVFDILPVGELGEVVSRAIYELERAGIPARGVVRAARVGRVADEIVAAAQEHGADAIVIGTSRPTWLGRLLFCIVSPRVLRLSPVPVSAIPTWTRRPAAPAANRSAERYHPAA